MTMVYAPVADTYPGYFALKEVITHDYTDQIIDEENKEVYSEEMMEAAKRATTALHSSYLSLASDSKCRLNFELSPAIRYGGSFADYLY
jgi:hypothetical protein